MHSSFGTRVALSFLLFGFVVFTLHITSTSADISTASLTSSKIRTQHEQSVSNGPSNARPMLISHETTRCKNIVKKCRPKTLTIPVIIGIVAGVIAALMLSSSISAFLLYYFIKKRQQRREDTEQSRAQGDPDELSHQPRYHSGDVIPGAPPPGLKGWEPEHLKAKQFQHRGALKINMDQPLVMDHALEDDTQDTTEPNPAPVWDDDGNVVYDIGEGVEEYYKHGQKVPDPYVSNRVSSGQSKRRFAEAQDLRAIRED